MLELEVKPERSMSSGRWEFTLGIYSITDHLSYAINIARNAAGTSHTDSKG